MTIIDGYNFKNALSTNIITEESIMDNLTQV